MFTCVLYLKNEKKWLKYATEEISNSTFIDDNVIEKILTFPFDFGLLNSYSELV